MFALERTGSRLHFLYTVDSKQRMDKKEETKFEISAVLLAADNLDKHNVEKKVLK